MNSVPSIFPTVSAVTELYAARIVKPCARALVFLVLITTGTVNAEQREVFFWDADGLDYMVDGSDSRCSELWAGSVIDPDTKRSGSASLRHEITGVQRNTGCRPTSEPRGAGLFDGGSIYWTTWIKLSDDFNWGTYHKKIKFAHLKRSNERTPVYGVIYIGHDGFHWTGGMISGTVNLNVDMNPRDGSCSSARNSNLERECTEWRQYTIHMQQNTCASCSDGVFEVFVDGVLADRVENTSFASDTPSDGVLSYNFAWAGLGGFAYPQMCANGDSCPGIGGSIWLDDMAIQVSSDGPIVMSKPLSPSDLM